MKTFGAILKKANRALPRLLELYVILQPVLDALTSLGVKYEHPLTVGMITRVLFIAAAAIYIFFGGRYPGSRAVRVYFGAVTAYLAAFGLFYLFRGGLSVCVQNLSEAAKVFYFLYACGLLYALYRRRGFAVSDGALAKNCAGYCLIILLAYVTGTSFISYNSGYGYCGWFYSASDVSTAILLTAPLLLLAVLRASPQTPRQKRLTALISALVLLALVFSASFMATKLVYIGALLYLFAAAVWFAVSFIKKRARELRRALLITVVTAAALLAIYPISPLNENIADIYIPMSGEDQEAYEQSLQIEGISETDRAEANRKIDENAEGTLLGELVETSPLAEKLNWLLGRRLLIIAPVAQQYIESGAAEKLLGIGYVQTDYCSHPITHLVEMEGMALLLRHGVVGLLLYYLPFLCVCAGLLVGFFKRFKRRMADFRYCSLLYSVMMALAASLLLGHVLQTPCTSLLAAVLLQKLILASLKPDKLPPPAA